MTSWVEKERRQRRSRLTAKRRGKFCRGGSTATSTAAAAAVAAAAAAAVVTAGRGTLEDYTENISLLENFSTPLSASIVIYARDEGGYGPLYGF